MGLPILGPAGALRQDRRGSGGDLCSDCLSNDFKRRRSPLMKRLITLLAPLLAGCGISAKVDPPVTSTISCPVPSSSGRVTTRRTVTTQVTAPGFAATEDLENPIPVRRTTEK